MRTGTCLRCRRAYEARRGDRVYCSDRCRTAHGREKKAQAQADREARVRGLLDEALRVLGSGSERESSRSRV